MQLTLHDVQVTYPSIVVYGVVRSCSGTAKEYPEVQKQVLKQQNCFLSSYYTQDEIMQWWRAWNGKTHG
jgi:hypothetical protein